MDCMSTSTVASRTSASPLLNNTVQLRFGGFRDAVARVSLRAQLLLFPAGKLATIIAPPTL